MLGCVGKLELLESDEIVEPLEYAENSTWQRYSGYDTLDLSVSDVLTAAKFDWKQAAVTVRASGLEMRQNSGEERIINLVESRVKNAMHTFANNISRDIYSDGTAPNQIGGLQLLVSDTGLGVVGGIDSTAFPFWRNKVQSAAAPIQGGGAIIPSKTTIKTLMNPLWYELTRGNDLPDVIVSSNDYFGFYEESLQDNQRFMDKDEAAAGFSALMYKTAKVFHDGGTEGGGIPNAHMYFLNTRYLRFVAHRDADMTELEDVRSVNQDAMAKTIIWQGNLTVRNRSLQGVLRA